MNEPDIDNAQAAVMLRTMDAWYIANPVLVHDVIMAWLESVECIREMEDTIILVGNADEIG